MMRVLRIVISVIFVVTTALFVKYWYRTQVKVDRTYPVIKIDNDMIEVDIDATTEDLLAGVSAFDEKDGDLTAHVIVESISKFTDNGICKVYYAVCDQDNHVASAFRKIRYKGYKKPQFFMNRSLCFSQLESIDVSSVIGATDVIDGDISANIIFTSADYEYGVLGTYTVKAEVSNSKGDQISIALPMIVENRNINAPTIVLSQYLIYVEKGARIDPMKYFVSARDSFEKDIAATLHLENDYQADQPGVYSFHYYAVDELNRQGHSVLTVVVE